MDDTTLCQKEDFNIAFFIINSWKYLNVDKSVVRLLCLSTVDILCLFPTHFINPH